MAKAAMIERNKKRRRMNARLEGKRAELKARIKDKDTPPEERFQAVLELSNMPRNSSKTRINNICGITGRPRGVYRRFNLCRNVLRELASKGQLPGVKKSSW